MATDRLPNSTQMQSVADSLATIAQKSQTPYSTDNKLPTDYATDTNQTNKFATAEQLQQIETNKTNILLSATYTATATADGETNRATFAGLIASACSAAGIQTTDLITYELSAYSSTGNSAFYGYGKYKSSTLHTLNMITNDTITKYAVNNTGTVVLGDCTGNITAKVRIFG